MSLLVKLSPLSRNFNVETINIVCRSWLRPSGVGPYSISYLVKDGNEKTEVKRYFHICSNASIIDPKIKLRSQQSLMMISRNTSFFNKITAEMLWKGVTSVSNAGKMSGRGKSSRLRKVVNLNRGQYLGIGVENMIWPGLNAAIIKDGEIMRCHKLPKDENRTKKLIDMRDNMVVFKSLKLTPLERGWSGRRLPGRSIGPPDPIGEDHFAGFDTKVLEQKIVSTLTKNHGRKRRISLFVITGNKNGLAGFGLSKANTLKSVMKQSKAVAGQRLIYIERCDGHTVFHDFHCKFLNVNIHVKRKPEGYGLVCHRAIREICQMIGIKNLHAKVEGSTNVQNMTKAFFIGLLNQHTHQKLADEKGLYVAKIRPGSYPEIVATPSHTRVRTREDIRMDEEMDFKMYTMDGKIQREPKKFVPFYQRLPSWERHLKKMVKCRNHDKIKKQLTLEYGEVISFLTADHPECRPFYKIPDEEE